jgi:hypothetical protein
VWRRIVRDTLTAGPPPDPAISAWLREQEAAAGRRSRTGSYSGVGLR